MTKMLTYLESLIDHPTVYLLAAFHTEVSIKMSHLKLHSLRTRCMISERSLETSLSSDRISSWVGTCKLAPPWHTGAELSG
jgi:hypothetical protein